MAVTKQMVTKMQEGLVNRITSKTFGKIIGYNLVQWMGTTTGYGAMDGTSRRYLDY